MNRGVLVAALLAAATGGAAVAAEEGEGDVVATFHGGTRFDGLMIGFLVESEQTPLELNATRLAAAHVYKQDAGANYTRVALELSVEDKPERRFANLTRATAAFVPWDQIGHLGVHADAEPLRVTVVTTGLCSSKRSTDTQLAAGWNPNDIFGDRNKPGSLTFYRRFTDPHLHLACTGPLRIEGPATVQPYGLILHLTSDQGSSTTRTGEWPLPGLLPQDRRQWTALSSGDLALDVDAPLPWEMILLEVRTETSVVTPNGVEILDGTSVAPLAGLPSADAESFLSYSLVFLGAAVVVGGVLAHRARRRRFRSALEDAEESWDAEECVRRAEVHIQTERFERALEWILLARKRAPTSATVRATEAFLLGALGRTDEALDAYRAASRLCPSDGEPDLSGARLALEREMPPHVVEEFVERALRKSPRLVQEVDEQGEFRALAGRPRFDRAVSAAWDAFVGHVSRDDPGE